jgi:hypothetical protein
LPESDSARDRRREQKRKTLERISSTESTTPVQRHRLPPAISRRHNQDQVAPIFYQPNDPQHPARPEGSGNPADTEEEDEGLDEEAMLTRLQKLPEDERWKSVGRIFVLKVWPWVNNSWWLLNVRGTNDPGAATDLDTQIGDKLPVFLGIDMNIPTEEWIRDKFRQEVFFYNFLWCRWY